jgi:signal transduction histidine kinase
MGIGSTQLWARARQSLIDGGTRSGQEYLFFVVNVYMLIAFLSLVVFGLLNLAESRSLVAHFELVGGLAVALNAIGLRATRNVSLARAYFLVIILTMLFAMLLTGGTEGSGIFWFFTFPVIAFFLTGRQQGIRWMIGLYAMIGITFLLSELDILSIPYAPITIRQLVVSVTVVAIGIYAYQGAREQAERTSHAVDQTKSDFVALASHQLRTPISAISWFAELLLSGDSGRLTSEQRKNIEQVYASNQRMAALVGDMLTVSSLDMQSLPIAPVQSDLTELSRGALGDIKKSLLADRKLTIQEDYPDDLPSITLDPDIMRTILHNLLSNAIKYTPDGGTITIHISTSDKKLHHGSAGSVHIAVKDTGYGIPKAVQTKIFSKFFRGPNITDKDTDGTGLGLFIVKSLLDYVGGTVSFTSRKDVGSTFTVTLPLEGMLEKGGIKDA